MFSSDRSHEGAVHNIHFPNPENMPGGSLLRSSSICLQPKKCQTKPIEQSEDQRPAGLTTIAKMSESIPAPARRKRKRSTKSHEGPARQKRKVDDDTKSAVVDGITDLIEIEDLDTSIIEVDVSVQAIDGVLGSKTKRKRKHHRRSERPTVTHQGHVTRQDQKGWQLDLPKGGRYIWHDPVFSADGQYILAATSREVRLLSIETSLAERAFGSSDSNIVAYALSAATPSHIYVASDTGTISQWDWTTGVMLAELDNNIGQVSSILASSTNDGLDALWTIQRSEAGWHIVLNQNTLYTSSTGQQIVNLSIHDEIIVASCGSTIIVGSPATSDEGSSYTFVEHRTATEITCLAARTLLPVGKKPKKAKTSISLAIGNDNGEIYLYDDALVTLPQPRKLHWHRECVEALKWSKDGNYLISGGKETVLVLWQLATGKKQFLPHLAAEIESLSVRPDGAAYALQLADNSIMVLSTSELTPIANFAGLQAVLDITTSHTNTSAVTPTSEGLTYNAAIHPSRLDELMVVVQSSSPRDASSAVPRPFLQTYDIAHDRHLYRQALSRNKLTDFTTGPEGNRINEPNVTLMQPSHDGSWLATVEEWTPPLHDNEFLAADEEQSQLQNVKRLEVYLKLWRWDAVKNIWVLDTRIDNPHPVDMNASPGRILSLSANPKDIGFATIGQDSQLRIWRPQTRRDGAKNIVLEDWKARHTVPITHLASTSDADDQTAAKGCLAYSADGSLLAVSVTDSSSSESSPITFVHTDTGKVLEQQSGSHTGTLVALGFLDRHLIIVSSITVTLWDIVNMTLVHRANLHDTELKHPLSHRARLLCISATDDVFAVAVPVERLGHPSTRVQIFQPVPFRKTYDYVLDGIVTSVLSAKGRSGFTLLLASGEIVTLTQISSVSSGVSTSYALQSQKLAVQPVGAGIEEDIMPDDEDLETNTAARAVNNDQFLLPLHERRVVRPEDLSAIFDGANGQGTLNMPVKSMFDAVLSLYTAKA